MEDMWRYIARGWGDFSVLTSFHLMCGSRIRFWRDKWGAGGSLEDLFLGMFRVGRDIEGSVAESWG